MTNKSRTRNLICLVHHSGTNSKYAFAEAAKIARRTNSNLVVFSAVNFDTDHTIDKSKYSATLKSHWVQVQSELAEYQQWFIEQVARPDELLSLHVGIEIKFGTFSVALNEFIGSIQPDLVVLQNNDALDRRKESIQVLSKLRKTQQFPVLMVGDQNQPKSEGPVLIGLESVHHDLTPAFLSNVNGLLNGVYDKTILVGIGIQTSEFDGLRSFLGENYQVDQSPILDGNRAEMLQAKVTTELAQMLIIPNNQSLFDQLIPEQLRPLTMTEQLLTHTDLTTLLFP